MFNKQLHERADILNEVLCELLRIDRRVGVGKGFVFKYPQIEIEDDKLILTTD